MTSHANDMETKHNYNQKECQALLREASILPLPSPPIQTGDAVFVRRPTELDTCLPSFNHLKTPSRSCSSASSSPTPNEFTSDVGSTGYGMDINEMHPRNQCGPEQGNVSNEAKITQGERSDMIYFEDQQSEGKSKKREYIK